MASDPGSSGTSMERRNVAVRDAQNRMVIQVLINLLITIAGPLFFQISGNPWDYGISFALGLIIITIFDRSYIWHVFWSVIFIAYLLWEIILSNLSLAWLVIQPRLKLDPGIIAIPLTVSTGLEITVLASAITLTPGTISVDLGWDSQGRRVLYVHNLTVGDPVAFQNSVKQGFERLILRISRGL